MAHQHKILLDESEMPTRWYNVIPDLPSPPPPPLHPGTLQPVGPDDLAPAVPDGPDHAGGHPGPLRRHPRRGPRRLPAVAALAAVPRAPPRAGARHPGADLLQVRGRLAGRLAQAEHRRSAGVLQRPQRRHRSSRPRPAPGQWGTALAFACAVFGLDCEVWQVGASYDGKALPPLGDGDLRCDGASQPVRPHRVGAQDPRRRPGPSRQSSASRSARPSRSPPRTSRHALRAGQRAQPRAAAPDDHRRGGAAAVREGR